MKLLTVYSGDFSVKKAMYFVLAKDCNCINISLNYIFCVLPCILSYAVVVGSCFILIFSYDGTRQGPWLPRVPFIAHPNFPLFRIATKSKDNIFESKHDQYTYFTFSFDQI